MRRSSPYCSPITKLAATRAQDTDATVIGVTEQKDDDGHLSQLVDAVLPIPPITEATAGPYATRAVFLQMAALYVAVLVEDPDIESVRTVFGEAESAADQCNEDRLIDHIPRYNAGGLI